MTKMTLITVTTVKADTTFTNSDFACAFGHCLASLPVGQGFTAQQIRDKVAPDFTVQKVTAYLKMATMHGIMSRIEHQTGETFLDAYGNERPIIKALYTRV